MEVGTLAPIDIIEAEAEVASNEEAVINAEARIKTVEDRLRYLVLNPSQPDFWTVKLEPTDAPALTPIAIDVEGAITNALANRTDIARLKKQLDNVDVGVRFAENQRMPGLDVVANYNVIGYAGTQFEFGQGFPPPVVDQSVRSFTSALRDVFGQDFRTWSVALNFSYPLGTSQADAAVASGRLQRQQGAVNLRDLELQVATAVRDAARQVDTNLKRVEATRKARDRAERRLEAEAEAHDRRPLDDVPAVPGAARPRPPAAAGSERDDRLQPLARRLRSHPDRSGQRALTERGQRDSSRTRTPEPEVPSSEANAGPRLGSCIRSPWLWKLAVYLYTSLRDQPDRHGHHPQRRAPHRRGARVGRLGRRDRRRRLGQHRRHGRHRAGATRRVWCSASGPATATQKNYAADLASHDWILSIDADERVTPALAAEIRALLQREPNAAGYEISRVAHYLGRWIRSTDWYPDYQLRLYDRRTARWSEHAVHESIQCPGRVERLRGELQHYPYRDISDHLAKIDRYTTLIAATVGSRRPADGGVARPSSIRGSRSCATTSCAADSATAHTGLVVSMLNSYYVFLKYAKLFEMQQTGSAAPAPSARDAGPAPGAGPAAG